MGKRNKQQSEPINEPIITEGTTTDNGNSDTTKTKKGRPRKSESRTEKEIIPRLVNVEIPTEEKEIPEPKPKKSSKKKNVTKSIALESEQVAVLIKSTFDIIGNKKGFEIWKLSEPEVKQIAEPLTNVLKRFTVFEKTLSQYADIVALLLAVGTIIIPRVIVMQQVKKQEKKEIVTNDRKAEPLRTERNESRKAGTSDKHTTRPATVTREDFGEHLFNSIPSII